MTLRPARVVFSFEKIRSNQVTKKRLQALVKRSKIVQNIVVFPPVEDGDRVMEFTLKSATPFQIHQPTSREGRLVLDFKTVTP